VKFIANLEKRSRTYWIILAGILLVIVGGLDYLTGSEITLSFFYLVPIALLTWVTNRKWGIAGSVACALVWVVSDVAAGKGGMPVSIYAWNTLIVFGFFLVVTLLISALRQALDHARELSQTDFLTGAVSRRFFFELLQMEIERSLRYAHQFSIAYIDIDNFKSINDRLGHAAGDQALCLMVERVRSRLRKTDLVARLGGDEFAILLPETDQAAAQAILTTIHSEIIAGLQAGGWDVTISIGVLTCQDPPPGANEVIAKVDEVMYSVKHAGKNAIKFCATCAPCPPETGNGNG